MIPEPQDQQKTEERHDDFGLLNQTINNVIASGVKKVLWGVLPMMAAVCISDDVLVMPKIQAPETYSPSYDVAKDFKILTTGVAAADVKIHSVRIVAVKGSSEF